MPAGSLGADQTPPPGLSAHGTLVAQAVLNGTRISLGGEIAMMTRGKQLRMDLIRLGVPGTDPAVSALLAQFLPQGGLSFVLDQGTGATTVWSDSKRKYYVFKAAASPTPAPSPGATEEPTFGSSIVELLETPGKYVKDYTAFSFAMKLLPRSTVNGHPASNVHMDYHAQKRGEKMQDASVDLALAEDQQYLPVRLSASVKPQNFSARIDFTQISAASPDPALFAVPQGYAAAADPSEIFGTGLPH